MAHRSRLSIALALLALASAACAWSVPADPGKNAALRSRVDAPAPRVVGDAPAARSARGEGSAAGDSAARAIYVVKCAQCHEAFPPDHVSAAEWPALVRKYGPRAGLFGDERQSVLAWLQANAR